MNSSAKTKVIYMSKNGTYCLSCGEDKRFSDPEIVEMDNGKKAKTEPCPDCGTKMFRILPDDYEE